MRLNNPYCDICGRYCEIEWHEIKSRYRMVYRNLNEKRNETFIVCGKCKRALFDLIKERGLKEE